MTSLFTYEQVQAGPPTIEQIQAEAHEERQLFRLLCLAFAAVLVAGAVGAYFDSPVIVIMSLMLALFTGMTVATSSPAMNYEFVAGNEACDKLYQACEQSPEGRAYRQAVIAQGRRFIKAELYMLDAWNQARRLDGACKRLYDVPA